MPRSRAWRSSAWWRAALTPQTGVCSILGLTPEGLAAVHSGRNAVVDRIAAVLEESFTDEETAILAAAAPLIERLADLL